MAKGFLDGCGFHPVSYSDTDDFEVDTGINGYALPALCLNPVVVDGVTYNYTAISDDGTEWESGRAEWDDGADTLLRATGTVDNSSDGGAKITFTAAPRVIMGGPVANDLAFRGYENIATDNTTPATINPDVLITYVTTDGSGLGQTLEMSFDSLTEADYLLPHLVIFATQADPGDVLSIDGESTITLSEEGMFAMFEFAGPNSGWVFKTGFIDEGVLSESFPVRDPEGAVEYVSDPGIVGFRQDLELSVSTEILMEIFQTRFTSDGSAGANNIALNSGFETGGRKYLVYRTQTVPGDTIVFDTSNIQTEAGATPASVVLAAEDDEFLIEWRGMRGAWVIIDASGGVVTL